MNNKAVASKQFLLNAGQAAKLEQTGLYADAAMWWKRAAKNRVGTSWANTKWAIHRREYCFHWKDKVIGASK
ncbi:ANR family transcriptional regulator [Vibrio vulnificus]|nr:ANR family transcriptional regulator [Vibrio vulnificus]